MSDERPPLADGWPAATLDPIARLRVLAAGLPGTVVHERTIDAPFDRVWGFIADLERSVPTFDDTVSRVAIVGRPRDGERFRIRTRSGWRMAGLPLSFDVDLEPGWCWMVSRPRLYAVGMAAVADGEVTRYGHLEGLAIPGRALSPLLPLTRRRHDRHVRSDVDGIERALRQG